MVCEILASICAYEGTAPTFTRWTLDRVAEIYFTRLTGNMSSSSAPPPTLRAATPDARERDDRGAEPPRSLSITNF
jgi:hypothetical protein